MDTDEDGFGTAGDRVLDKLVRLGVIQRVAKDRIDIPDIYRLHFKIDRRGQKVTPRGWARYCSVAATAKRRRGCLPRRGRSGSHGGDCSL